MKAFQLLLSALLATTAISPSQAIADDYEDLDSDGSSQRTKVKKQSRTSRQVADQEVREINKGLYAKATVGGGIYLGQFRGFVNPGTTLGLSVGKDFLDRETQSAAWEFMFVQGIHNGCHYEYQVRGECSGRPGVQGPLVQGDLRTYTVAAAVDYAFYPNRRWGISIRGGAGVLFSPLLMDQTEYQEDVVLDTWGGINPTYHETPHPIFLFGPGFEYYTKLSHFSVGLDTDVFYGIGFDLGMNIAGYMKYTF
jgi:hypothetical protein